MLASQHQTADCEDDVCIHMYNDQYIQYVALLLVDLLLWCVDVCCMLRTNQFVLPPPGGRPGCVLVVHQQEHGWYTRSRSCISMHVLSGWVTWLVVPARIDCCLIASVLLRSNPSSRIVRSCWCYAVLLQFLSLRYTPISCWSKKYY